MIEIEFEEPTKGICDCCGNTTLRLTRFVYSDGNAHAVYYAQFTKEHVPSYVSGIIGLGEWGEGGKPEDRLAFPFRIWVEKDSYKVGLVDAELSPWHDVSFLGQILDRDEALRHEWIQEVFHITDHIVADDPEIKKFLD